MTQEPAPRVFISYSHDSEEHAVRVLALADRLRTEGIEAILDQYEMSPPEGWPRWMDRQVRDADVVVMVCTETFTTAASWARRRPGKDSACAGKETSATTVRLSR